MGFYQPAQIVTDARQHGVEVRAIDINESYWDNTLEAATGDYHALRLGFRQIKGIREEDINALVAQRQQRYASMQAQREIGLAEITLEKLADADAFRSLGLDRRQALWEISTKDHEKSLFTATQKVEEKVNLPEMQWSEHVIYDYASTTLSIKAHPLSFIREDLAMLHVIPMSKLAEVNHGNIVKVAGLILIRQRPGTAKGVCFITIKDETGTSNLVIFSKLFDKYRAEIVQSKMLIVEGQVQKEGQIIHVVVRKCYDGSRLLKKLNTADLNVKPMPRSDETTSPTSKPKTATIIQGEEF